MGKSHIASFIQSLHPDEIKRIKEEYFGKHKTKNSQLQLFNFLIENPEREISEKEFLKKLKCSSSALRVLKSRLFEGIRSSLIAESYMDHSTLFSKREKMYFSLKRQLIFVGSLFRVVNQKRVATIKILLFQIITKATYYQLYDLLVEALIIKKRLQVVRYGLQEFNNINQEIIFYDYSFKSVQFANDIYYELILKQEFLTIKELLKFISSTLKKLQADYKKTKATEINYYIILFKTAFFEYKKDYAKAIYYCKMMLTFLKGNEISYNKNRMGLVLSNIGLFHNYLKEHDKALMYIKSAGQFHFKKSYNYLIIKEQEFFSYWYSKNYLMAEKCNQEMLNHLMVDAGSYRKSKFIFYGACLYFIREEYNNVLKTLNQSLEIEKDKTGWNVFIRILLIQTLIELSKFKEAGVAIQALRKHLERNKKDESERIQTIFKLLREIEKDNFILKLQNKKVAELFNKLSDKNDSCNKHYPTTELILFHEWITKLPEKR